MIMVAHMRGTDQAGGREPVGLNATVPIKHPDRAKPGAHHPDVGDPDDRGDPRFHQPPGGGGRRFGQHLRVTINATVPLTVISAILAPEGDDMAAAELARLRAPDSVAGDAR
jgi:hypothetical protein